jgi:hypothetical protein
MEGRTVATTTVQISESSHQILKQLAEETGHTMTAILDRALDTFRRKVFFEGLKADYDALKADPEAWAEYEAERKLWDATLMDGLDPDERWTEDGRCLTPEPPAQEGT